MSRSGAKTTERVDPGQWSGSREEYLLYLRHLFAYEFAASLLRPGDAVLEVGAGEGYGATLLARSGARVTGLDVDAETVRGAAGKYASNSLDFRHYDGREIPAADASFDAVVSFQVIEHVQDVPFFLGEIHRVMKPGGTMLLTTPNRAYRLRPGQKPWNRFHLREYDDAEFSSILRPLFSDVAVRAIRGTDEVQAIEYARVAWALRRGPVSVLRRNMPEPVRRLAGRILRLCAGASRTDTRPDFRTKYTTADYSVVRDKVEQGLDLLAVCRKQDAVR